VAKYGKKNCAQKHKKITIFQIPGGGESPPNDVPVTNIIIIITSLLNFYNKKQYFQHCSITAA